MTAVETGPGALPAMRTTLSTLAALKLGTRAFLRRLDGYTLWAFSPQREPTTRYER